MEDKAQGTPGIFIFIIICRIEKMKFKMAYFLVSFASTQYILPLLLLL